MDQISNVNQVQAAQNVSQQPNFAAQPKVSLDDPKDSFERSSDKGILLGTGAVGAAAASFGAEPLAQKIVSKKIDKDLEATQKLISQLLFEDMPKEDFAKIIKKLQKNQEMSAKMMEGIAEKVPEALKDFDISNQEIQSVAEHVKKLAATYKESNISKMTAEQIEALHTSLLKDRDEGYTNIGKLLKGDGALFGQEIAEEAAEGTAKHAEKAKGFLGKLFNLSDETISKSSAEDLGKTIKENGKKGFRNMFEKIHNAFKPIKDSIIKNVVKIPTKYKIGIGAVGGLQQQGL
jgi:hypothetical protein